MRNTSSRFRPDVVTAVNAFLAEIAPLAEKQGVTLAQLVIGWTLSQPGITHVLCGVRNARQGRENAAAGAQAFDPAVNAFISERLDALKLSVPKAFS
jgi:aryl-alcohol dehydrogenase-like predicted oxidoreductase